MLTWLLGTDGDWVIAIVRIVLGVVFFAHGAQKTLGWFGGAGLQNTMSVFREHLRIPAPLALLAVAARGLSGPACSPVTSGTDPVTGGGFRCCSRFASGLHPLLG